jgi:hypothetical protein
MYVYSPSLPPLSLSHRSTLPKSVHSPPDRPNPDGQAAVEGTSGGAGACNLQVWTSVTSALCTANNNPQNGT